MTLKIKDKKIIWTKLYFRQFYNERGLFVDKGSGFDHYPDIGLKIVICVLRSGFLGYTLRISVL